MELLLLNWYKVLFEGNLIVKQYNVLKKSRVLNELFKTCRHKVISFCNKIVYLHIHT